MKLGIVIEETWDFFHEIYADFCQRHQTTLFQRRTVNFKLAHTRMNNYLFQRDLNALLRNNDVVFFEWASHLLAAASHLPKQCAIVTRLHRYEMYEWAERINWQAVDKVILVSRAKEREFLARFPQQAGKSVVVSPCTSLEKFSFSAKPFNGDLGILCHLTPRKRVYDLLLIFYELVQQEPALHLHIAGGAHIAFGDYAYSLYSLVRKLNLQDKVTFYGNVKETWAWYGKIDLFVSHSYNEGLQVAPMEAMASGCYCLAHCWDGAEELVPAQNLYIGPGDLAHKVLTYCALAEDEKQRQRRAMRAWACERFDIRKTVQEVRNIVDMAYAGRSLSRPA